MVATSTDPNLGAIRLAWWRERLEELCERRNAPAEPRLQAIMSLQLTNDATGVELSKLEDAWRPLLEPFPWGEPQADGLKLRGRILFRIGARLLGWDPVEAEPAGALWSLIDGAAHCSDTYSRTYLLAAAREAIRELPRSRPPRQARGMTVLAALAAHEALRDKPLDMGGDWGRVAVATAHRLRGSLPRS